MRLLGTRLLLPMSLRRITILIGVMVTISTVITIHVLKNIPIHHELNGYKVKSEGNLPGNADSDNRQWQFSNKGGDGNVNSSDGARVTRNSSMVMARSRSTGPGTPEPSDMWIVIDRKMKQIDSTLEQITSIKQQVAALVSDRSQQTPEWLSSSLKRHGFHLQDNPNEDWSLLWCGENTGCPSTENLQSLDISSKVNVIPSLNDALVSKKSLCETYQSVKNIPSFKQSHLVLSCFIFPSQFEEFVMTSSALGGTTTWVIHAAQSGSLPQLIQPSSIKDFTRLKQYQNREAVAWQYFSNPALLFGLPFSVRLLVLVTSSSPLRVYIHSQGAVLYRHDYQRNFQKVINREWSLGHFSQYLLHHYGRQTHDKALRNLDSVTVQTLLAAEFRHHLNSSRCSACFQLFGIEAIFNTSFHPVIIDVTRNPLTAWHDVIDSSHIFDDVINMISGWTLVPSGDGFVHSLKEIAVEIGFNTLCGEQRKTTCLNSEVDVWYFLNQMREVQRTAGFRQLYPAPDIPRYSHLMNDLNRLSFLRARRLAPPMDTVRLYPVLVAMEKHAKRSQAAEEYEDENLPIPKEVQLDNLPLIERVVFEEQHNKYESSKPKCSESPETVPYLSGIHFKPALDLLPQFYPATLEYHVTVPYEMVLVTVWAHAMSCSCEARLEDRYGLSRPTNYTLGIGENRIDILVVEVSHSDPWVITVYTVYITRSGHHGNNAPFSPSGPHQVCSLQQDCSLQYIPSMPCGLQLHQDMTWKKFLQKVELLPICKAGATAGQWIVPCSQCADAKTCFWEEALWQPLSCRHQKYGASDVQQCMTNKKILFLGDSTNRGILHYIIERVNGSLAEWDKTHNIKYYPSLNHNRTAVSFAYFPQFWLPAAHRPDIGSTLHQLINRSLPLSNDPSTVLVLGGVQWLATHHLTAVLSSLKSHNLDNISLVMKSLGAGFHQPVEGLRYLSQKEHQVLFRRNHDLSSFASVRGFKIIDTFNITMARYRDFLQGKCACHFHRVTQMKEEETRSAMTFTSLAQSGILVKPELLRPRQLTLEIDRNLQYHVAGEINTVYSEMVINEICREI